MQQDELNEVKRLYDDERRKTSSNEKSNSQLTAENKSLNNKLRELQRDVDEYKSTIDHL
jgi:uncharacterized protein YlxW (UPF0749 family)